MIKICKCCGKEFETNRKDKIYCDGPHYLPCPVCGKPVLKVDKDFSRPPKCCSSKCSHELRMQHFSPRKCILCGEWFIPKSGIAKQCDKQHYRACEICGNLFLYDLSENPDQTTCSSECSKEKLRKFYNDKYGVDHPMQSVTVQLHHKQAMKEKYGVEFPLQDSKFVQKQQETVVSTNLNKYGVPYACLLPQCSEAQGKIISQANRNVAEIIKECGLSYSFEKRLGAFSYDLCIEQNRTVIEVDPTYTHNAKCNHYGQIRDKKYHLLKTLNAEKYGYRCIHIFDWDDARKVISTLITDTVLYGRNLVCRNISIKEASEFLGIHHVQKSCRNQKYCYGLFLNNELYEVLTFGAPRYNKKYDFELLRLCTKSRYKIIGGASKLFSYARKQNIQGSIISYCDLAKFKGDVYSKLSMKLMYTTPPAKVWSKGSQKITDNLLRARGYDQIFKTTYGKGSSNDQLMIDSGWLPVYDCGQGVYVIEGDNV